MKKVVVNENEKGLLFRNGKFLKVLGAGKYHVFGGRSIAICPVKEQIDSSLVAVQTLLKNEDVRKSSTLIEVLDDHLAIHFVNGRFKDVLKSGTYLFWSDTDAHTSLDVDISSPEVFADFPVELFSHIPFLYYQKAEIAPWQKGLLFVDNQLTRVLEEGTHYFWRGPKRVEVKIMDTRLIQKELSGQELLTADKVSLRINFICHYRITDFVKAATEIDDYEEQLHVLAQLALREYVAKYTVDELLENKDEVCACVLETLSNQAKRLYISVEDAGIKDIILPGEIREIMNTVLVAQKRAQANVITRREEVASTRSLLNTAKLMDENKTLYRLKELEYVEKICSHVGSINVGSGAGLVDQLGKILAFQGEDF